MTGFPARLREAAIAGPIQTPGRDVLRKAQMLESGDPDATFGLESLLPTSVPEVLGAIERLGGWRPDERAYGGSVVDADELVGWAQRAAGRLQRACENGERVFLGTGHPTGPLELWVRLGLALRARGARIAHVADDAFVAGSRNRVKYVGGVACLSDGASLLHTHSPDAMRTVVAAGLECDLVVGDHGFAGVALANGMESIAMIDTNDPALVLAWARGLPVIPLLCDDNRPASLYEPVLELLLA